MRYMLLLHDNYSSLEIWYTNVVFESQMFAAPSTPARDEGYHRPRTRRVSIMCLAFWLRSPGFKSQPPKPASPGVLQYLKLQHVRSCHSSSCCHPSTSKARVTFLASSCGVCSGRSGTWEAVSYSTSVFYSSGP